MKVILTALAILSLSSCSTMHPISATANVVGSDKGKACQADILGFIPLSTDNSIYKAARNGGVKKIATVDAEIFWSWFYNERCTIVRGNK